MYRKIKKLISGQYVVLFFYPLDFTFVCPTEIIAFSDRIEEFKKIKTAVVGWVTKNLAFVLRLHNFDLQMFNWQPFLSLGLDQHAP